ncbi:hypothetical protein KGA66_23090 [Actinocrinis puniceicyclus]|uniref:Uncharacterized protein n=1 Tax=Actinocrinis puniceicyclus TaxID=977794 RepID=A0A8J8BEU6_9ACTN|nr:hypothetical protein [Actinocrinis puniceicyclus]MBS2965950.1 hypothetical protein [Actinocrinis puniceicyclus]
MRVRPTTLADLVGCALLAAGPVMLARGRAGRAQLRAELESQHIAFPAREQDLPEPLRHLAGRPVRSGDDARAFSELIKSHLAAATSGRTYAQITEECAKDGRGDEKLAALRQTAFMGETLRAGLMSAYQASNITLLVMGLGVLTTGVGASLLALSHADGRSRDR